MVDLAWLWLWAAAKAALVCLAGCLLYVMARRRSPEAGARLALAALLACTLALAAGLAPWPRWYELAREPSAAAAHAASSAAAEMPAAGKVPSLPQDGAHRPPQSQAAWWQTFWESWVDEMGVRRAPPTAQTLRWTTWLAAIALAGSLLCVLRLALAVRAVHRCCRRAQTLDTPELLALFERLRRKLGCRLRVRLAETDELSTAAAVGWLRPQILLPAHWHTWSRQELRAVLAHELAHLARRDALADALACACLALHWYQPLAQWLMRRLRLEQELAADRSASAVAGGVKVYLQALARLALEHDNLQTAWAIRPFLPRAGLLVRRIQMLRRSEKSTGHQGPGGGLILSAVLVALGLFVAGLRGPSLEAAGPASPDGGASPASKARAAPAKSTGAVAQATAPSDAAPSDAAAGAEGAVDEAAALDESLREVLALCPNNTDVLLMLRPAALFAQQDLRSLLKVVDNELGYQEQLGLSAADIDFVATVAVNLGQGIGGMLAPINYMIVRSKRPHDWQAVGRRLMGEVVEGTTAGQRYYRFARALPGGRGSSCFAVPDDRTLIVAQTELDMITALQAAIDRSERAWMPAWQAHCRGQACLMVQLAALRQQVPAERLPMGDSPDQRWLSLFAPVVEHGERAFVSLQVDRAASLSLDLQAVAGHGPQLEEASRKLLTFVQGTLMQLSALSSGGEVPSWLSLADTALALVHSGKLAREADVVRWHARLEPEALAAFVDTVGPAFAAARAAARRTERINNAKQIALAMHNYHDAYGHFPPAVLLGPDGKTPHSWRVALLPFLEQRALYEQYRLDEPWDSPNNLKVLEQMPAVYRTVDDPTSTTTNFYVLTGPDTPFGKTEGVTALDIIDGTSNTIMVVEAAAGIPWTKPEDLPYHAKQPLPKLGAGVEGGFIAAFWDGSVRFIPRTIEERLLRALITHAGREVLPANPF